jgi:hypothetical protein
MGIPHPPPAAKASAPCAASRVFLEMPFVAPLFKTPKKGIKRGEQWQNVTKLIKKSQALLQSKEECAKYIGKKVCTFDYTSPKNKRYSDSKKFYEYRTEATIYTITKIKFGHQIVLTLDNGRYTRREKINNGGPAQYDELSSCNVFFLCDDFEAYKNELIGTVYKNEHNEDVAVLENIELLFRIDEDPILVSTIRSKINNEEFICFSNDAVNLCNRIGTIISNPKVKDSYKVLSVNNEMPEDGKYKYIYANFTFFILKNADIPTGNLRLKIKMRKMPSDLILPCRQDILQALKPQEQFY